MLALGRPFFELAGACENAILLKKGYPAKFSFAQKRQRCGNRFQVAQAFRGVIALSLSISRLAEYLRHVDYGWAARLQPQLQSR